MAKTISKILIGSIVACGVAGCQKAAPTEATVPAAAPAPAPSLIGSWQHVAKDQGSNATMTFNPDGTMSFTATNGPKQQPYTEKGIGKWELTGSQLSMTPLSIDFDSPIAQNKKAFLPLVKKQEHVKATAPVVWKGNDEFVLSKSGVDQDFTRVKQ